MGQFNHLAGETSPYLLQHARNPVDWYPWGNAALQRAVNEDKPILLSIGYSACHWCHVMEHECFEDNDIAGLMNDLYVCIKVDREERPDLDKIYQLAHQLMTRRGGGWPLTAFLTPKEHAPIFIGTYFPPETRHGIPGFIQVLQQASSHYRQNLEHWQEQAETMQHAMLDIQTGEHQKISDSASEKAAVLLQGEFDGQFGGFGGAPKFPQASTLLYCIRESRNLRNDPARRRQLNTMVRHTLECMAKGGINDHVGGGFYRYSTDARWEIPHFEKMLYDNGQLLSVYSYFAEEAFFRQILEQTADWLLSEMQFDKGAFYAALDADSEGEEGKFYTWSRDEILATLGDEHYEIARRFWPLSGKTNFEGRFHLQAPDLHTTNGLVSDPAHAFSIIRQNLLVVRNKRIRPMTDDKIICSWNALAIKGLVKSGRALARPDYVNAAEAALSFLRHTLWQNDTLYTTTKNGVTKYPAYLDDYAYLADAVLELLELRWSSSLLDFSVQLCDRILEQFEDQKNGGFYFTAHEHESLYARLKVLADEAIPSGYGIAVSVLLKLGYLLGKQQYIESATRALEAVQGALNRYPLAHMALLQANQEYLDPPTIIVVRSEGPVDLNASAFDNKAIFNIPIDETTGIEALDTKVTLGGFTAYICRGYRCSPPCQSMKELADLLERQANDI